MFKKLFYISAAIFLLIATWTIASHRAQAQAGGDFVGISMYQIQGIATDAMAITSNGNTYAFDENHDQWNFVGHAQAGSPFVDISIFHIQGFDLRAKAVTTSGEVFDWYSGQWHPAGNIGGTINVQPETWGGVKQKFR